MMSWVSVDDEYEKLKADHQLSKRTGDLPAEVGKYKNKRVNYSLQFSSEVKLLTFT